MEIDNDPNKNNPFFQFKCGEMFIENGKVKPNPAKGYVKIYKNEDFLLIWEWVNQEDLSKSSEPFVIFPNDCKWKKVNVNKGRVYRLISSQFEESFIYWIQEEEDALKDEILERQINSILERGSLEDVNEILSGDDKGDKKDKVDVEVSKV